MMMQNNLLEKNVTSFFFSTNKNEESEILFGGVDENKHEGNMTWHEVRD